MVPSMQDPQPSCGVDPANTLDDSLLLMHRHACNVCGLIGAKIEVWES
jgi:hypothetical protein